MAPRACKLLLVFLVCSAVSAAVVLPPKPSRYVTDNAGVLPVARAQVLNDALADFERQTSNQILVYIDHHRPGDASLAEIGAQAIRSWSVGQKGKDNGAILFVFVDDREMRMAVGYGLEGALTDARSRRILAEIVKPRFRQNDYAGGIEEGSRAIMAVTRGESFRGIGRTAGEHRIDGGRWDDQSLLVALFFFLVLPIVLLIGLILYFRQSAGARHDEYAGVGPMYRRAGRWPPSRAGDSPSPSESGSTLSSSSSRASSGDFSGGGDDGGGGGASGSW